jgi:virulence-associated protein VagC
MKVKVTEQGVTIPKQMLEGAREVDIRQEAGRVVVEPIREEEDPILGLGREPVACEAPDASAQHDRYLYDPPV